MKIKSMLKSAAVFCGAVLLGSVHWRMLNFLTDWSPDGGAGILWAAAIPALFVWSGTLLFRVPASIAARTAAAAILFLAAAFVDPGTPDSPEMWLLVAVVLSTPVGLVTAYFLRGIRDNAGAAALGYVIPALAVYLLVTHSMWYWLPVNILFYGGVAVLLLAAWRYKLSSMAWLSLTAVALIAGMSYPSYLELRQTQTQEQSDEPVTLPTIDGTRRLQPVSENGGGDVFRLGGQWITSYPVDFASRPATLIALLQFQNHNLLILTVVPPFSPVPLEFAHYPWVARIDWLSSDPGLARFLTNTTPGYYDAVISYMGTRFQLAGPYDLIFVTDGGAVQWVDFLTPGGVLAVTPNTDSAALAEHFTYRIAAAGPGRVTLYSQRPLETDLEKLDRQMMLAGMGVTPMPSGALEVLYSLPADYADMALPAVSIGRWPASEWFSPPWHGAPELRGWLILAAMLLVLVRLGRFWLERWSDWQRIGSDLDAGMSVGLGLVLVWAGLARQGEPLFFQVAALAVLALTAGVLPSGIRKTVGILIWVAPLAGGILLQFLPWGTVLAGVVAVLGVNYWRGGHSSHAPWAASRLFFAAALSLTVAALSLYVPGGLWMLTLAVFIWRRMPF